MKCYTDICRRFEWRKQPEAAAEVEEEQGRSKGGGREEQGRRRRGAREEEERSKGGGREEQARGSGRWWTN